MLGYFALIGDKAPHAARDSSEVELALLLNVVILTPATVVTVGV